MNNIKVLAIYFFVSLSIVFFTACGSKSENADLASEKKTEGVAEEESGNEGETAKSDTEQKSKGKYQIKSGQVTFKTDIMGMDQKVVIIFDDYGNKETTDTYTEAMGQSDHTRTIISDGFAYSLNMNEKTATKTKIIGAGAGIDYSNISDEMQKKMNLKKLGKESILGYECEKMSYNYEKMKMKGLVWVHKGVPLKSEISAMGMDIVMLAEKFEQNPKISQEIFKVPEGFKIIETK